MTLPEPLAYRSGLFVNRETEIELVMDALQGIANGKTEQARTIVFRGERGLGKSWLVLHLHRHVLREEAPRLLPQRRIVSFLINLTPPVNYITGETALAGEWHITSEEALLIASKDEQSFEPVLRRLLNWLAEQLEVVRAPFAPVRDLSAWLAMDVRQKLDKEPNLVICLILDSVFETNHAFLDVLERYVLAALAALPRVLIVMTGRGRPYLWKSPYLRAERDEQPLSPFKDDHVIDQIRRTFRETSDLPEAVNQLSDAAFTRLAQRVIETGGGYPLTNHLLAMALVRRAFDMLPDDQRNNAERLAEVLDQTPINVEILEQVADRLLEVVPADDRHTLREAFEALCVLKDGFRENEMPYLLAARRNGKPEEPEYALPEMRKLRDRLLETNLVRWQDKRYALDEAVRAVLEAYLKLAHPDVWKRLHQSAARLYQEWGNKYSIAYYRDRAAFHFAMLQKETGQTVDVKE
ncbi:MAG: hypothetical protein RMJ55_06860 [Roseiflexaceae bacterium]|nr:hypothetical protein [Roseiflexaceae bacterium]